MQQVARFIVDKNSSGAVCLSPAQLPPQVVRLPRREREVAGIVYAAGGRTADDVRSALSVHLTNGAVRSMLNRLVAKGILSRRRSGQGKILLYVPAISADLSIEQAFQAFANDFFGGSRERALAKLDALFAPTSHRH